MATCALFEPSCLVVHFGHSRTKGAGLDFAATTLGSGRLGQPAQLARSPAFRHRPWPQRGARPDPYLSGSAYLPLIWALESPHRFMAASWNAGRNTTMRSTREIAIPLVD
jgi:hypothetical protein